jgi:hypothetical protein
VAAAAITATRMAAAIKSPRRSPRLSGSVGGVLPVLVVGDSFVGRTGRSQVQRPPRSPHFLQGARRA